MNMLRFPWSVRNISAHLTNAGSVAITLFAVLLGSIGLARAAVPDIDLQVPAYTWTPDPVVNGGTTTFTITAQNNGPATSGTGKLTIDLPNNVNYVSNSGGCTYDGTPVSPAQKTLTCSITPLALGQTATITYTATGNGSGVQNTTATLVEATPTNNDTNGSNDALTKSVTSIKGANLVVTHTGSNPAGCTTTCTATAGSNYTFTVGVANNGPDPATTFKVTYNLPAATDFTFSSATPAGAGWSCPAPVGTTLTCSYSGSNIASGSSAPDIAIAGQIITSAGSITGGVTVASTDSATGDPDLTTASNGAITRAVTVTPGTNLQANKTMVSNATGLTTLLSGEAVTLTLSATNNGTQAATGVTVTDTVPADFTLGALPGSCSAVGQAITCTVGALAAGVTSANFVIPLTVSGSVGNNGTNIANVTRTLPVAGTNTPASVAYSIIAPFTRLTITKSKVPAVVNSPSGSGTDPVVTGGIINNTVVVTNSNSSTSAATGTVTVVETLNDHPNETFGAVTSAGWSFTVGMPAANQVTFTYNIVGSLARGASLPALTFTTNAVGSNMNLSNQVCTSGNLSAHSPADSSVTPQCSGVKTIYSTPGDVDIGITKATSNAHILTTDNAFNYTIVVTNHSVATTAPTLVVTDDIPMYQNFGNGVTTTGVVATLSGGFGAGESCSVNATSGLVTCTIKNLAAAASRTITIAVSRPFKDGAAFTNTASWDSPDIVQTANAWPDTATATVQVDALADVTVTNIAAAPNPVRVGMELTYTTSIKNIGASVASGVVLRQTIDTTQMSYVSGSASLTTGGSCLFVSSFGAGAYAGQAGIECTGFTLTAGESRQLTFKVIPNYSYYSVAGGHPPGTGPGLAYTSNANITTTTTESDAPGYANNSSSNTTNIIAEQIDIAVTKQEAMGYDPDGAGPATNLLHDPVAYGDKIKYLVTLRNNGPSLATQVIATDKLTPPGVWTSNYVSVAVDASSTYSPANTPTCAITIAGGGAGGVGTNAAPQTLTCYLGSSLADTANVLPAGKTVVLELTFQTGGGDPTSSITYSNTATVASAETGGAPYANDTLAGNNTVTETTTVLPKTDLYVLKSASLGADGDGSPYNINETFNYVLTVGNIGPSSAPGVRVTDALPTGFVRTSAAITVVPGGGVSLVTNSCTGPAAGAGGTVTCDFGSVPADATGTDASKQIVVTIPVRAAYPFSGPFLTNISNTASVAPIGGASIDPVATNNTSPTVNVQIRKNSIAGTVYADNNLNDAIDGAEGISGVTVTLTGTDSYTNTIAAQTQLTDASGNFLFDNLPPGSWKLVETQPTAYSDRYETAGSAGGDIPAATCNGTTNCAASAAANTIGGTTPISLPLTGTAATGYVFQEYKKASISGNVYEDNNNNGVKDAGEAAINGVTLTLSGHTYTGEDVCTIVTCATTTAAGAYSYASLPPSDATGYTVTETQPATHLPGKTTAGTVTGTGAVAGTVSGGANGNVIQNIKVFSNGASINNNFGELKPATISGYVFLDADTNAVRNVVTETAGITGLTITLTGTDDLGAVGPITATTGAGGAYSFTNLRPGTYAVAETVPAGLTHTGAQAGSQGGTIAAVVRAANVGVTGVGNTTISAVTVTAGQTATDNNFGESGQGISGYVYADLNNNGVKDAGEPGISGVSVTVSGLASNGINVCTVINPNPCTLTTDSTGAYSFNGLPASDASGYTLTEQAQASAPLSNYADGTDTKGTGITIGGSAANDVISGIGLVVGEQGINYNFGEIAASLAGRVYHDVDDNGSFNGSDAGIGSVTITLSGTTASGANVCTVMASKYPTCSVTTAADGTYSFTGLPAGSYTLTESQPADYADRTTTAGSAGAGSTTGTTIATIPLGAGVAATNYLFGEKTGSLSGYVYLDANNDGTKGGTETGISGVTLTLSGTTASGASVCTVCTTTTAADGSYSFTGLKNANGAGYTVTETQPASYVDGKETAGASGGTVNNSSYSSAATYNGISAIPFTVSSSYTNYNFGELQTATLSGYVFVDSNSNAVRDAAETSGMTGVTVTLTGTNDLGAIAPTTTTTGVNGAYSFTGLRPGTYTVTETTPVTGMTHTGAQAGSKGGSAQPAGTGMPGVGINAITNIPIVSGDNATANNFGEYGTSSIAGSVYHDVDNSGTKNAGDANLSGITITLTGATTSTTTTDASGNFSFSGLPPGTYALTETQPVNYADATTTAGSSGGSVTGTTISNIVLAASTSATGYLFGERTGSLSGVVYLDVNNDGLNGTGDRGIAGVVMTLSGTTAAGANICASGCPTTTTGSDGSYSFSGLAASNGAGYTVTETQPVDYADRTTTPGTSGGSATGTTVSGIVLGAGVNASGYLFGEKTGSLSGFVYLDANDDGVKGTGDSGIAGVVLKLSGTTASGVNICATSCPTATTTADGAFSFSGLAASNAAGYTLTETQPVEYADRTNAVGTLSNGTAGAVTSGTVISGIAFGAGATGSNYLFGEKTSGLSGYVYLDANDNGVKDAGETGLAGVTITLSGNTAAGANACAVTCPTAVTAADGSYSFPAMLAGTYTLTETPPTGYLDGKETAGTITSAPVGTALNAGYDNTAANNQITGIVLPAGQTGVNYLFGERGARLSGAVYFDQNNDGLMSGALEIGLSGVTVTLSGLTTSGVDVCTLRSSCATVTNTGGAFAFDGVPPGTYQLVEDQITVDSKLYFDGKETLGVAGGVVDNSGFGTNAGYNTIKSINITSANISANAGNIGGYLFGEKATPTPVLGLIPPIVSGYVYRDYTHTRTRPDPTVDDNAAGWTATLTALRSDGTTEVICSVLTDAVGFYHLDNLNCLANYPQWSQGLPISGSLVPNGGGVTYSTFSIGFAKPNIGISTVPQSGGNAGKVDTAVGMIVGLELHNGDNITEQNLPLDPSGVIYDAITRIPVAGAQVRIFSGGVLVPGACLLSGQNTITTGTSGFYQFLLLSAPGCPGTGTYTLTVVPPVGYAPGISTMIPPTAGPHTPPTGLGTDPIQAQVGAPVGANPTTYFLSFNLTVTGNPLTSSFDVVNNHIPIDPVSAGLITVTKTTPLVNVVKGDLVPYTVTATNTTAANLSGLNITDQMPPGFKYRAGSATLNGKALEPVVNGRQLTWENQAFAANEKKTMKLLLMVGTGVGEGEYVNQAFVINGTTGNLSSNVASATVRVVPDPTFDCSDLIGKVFDDKNTNGYQDEGEPGIPNVRIATPRGLLVTTDAEGRFHVACAEIPQVDHGSNYVMKLDERTLPSGYRVTTENPRDVRTTRGKMVKLNFGAALHRVVRLDVNDAAFEAGSDQLKAEWQQKLETLPDLLKEKASVLRLAYKVGADGKAVAEARLKAISDGMRERWQEKRCCHILLIEEEIIASPVQEGK